MCRAAGAARVIVADIPVHDAARVLERSGIAAAVAAAGGEFVMPAALGFEWAELARLRARSAGRCSACCSRPTG